jgi:hypothetical protein
MVEVTYNTRATAKQLDAFRVSLLEKDAGPVVVEITGWPEKTGALSEDAPTDFRYWVGYGGWQAGVRALMDDPLFSTPPKHSTKATTPGV